MVFHESASAHDEQHSIQGIFTRSVGTPKDLGQRCKVIEHGDRNVVIVEQGYIGYAMDNGIPVLLPQGLHCWTSNSLHYIKAVPLNDHVIRLGPYTILTVDEGYAAVTQNNGKQMVLKGGQTHFLTHKNWKFQKFLSLKIQSDDLQRMTATTADNIELIVSATITWRVTDVLKAAVNSESTSMLASFVMLKNCSVMHTLPLSGLLICLCSFRGSLHRKSGDIWEIRRF